MMTLIFFVDSSKVVGISKLFLPSMVAIIMTLHVNSFLCYEEYSNMAGNTLSDYVLSGSDLCTLQDRNINITQSVGT